MTYDGAGSIFALGLRLTKLDAAGLPVVGRNQCYVTDALVHIGCGLNFEEGEEVIQRKGDGTVCVYYKAPDTVKSAQIEEFRVCTPDPNIRAFLIGGSVITRNEVQTVTVGAGATGGTFTLTFEGQTTAGIAYNATAAAVLAALEALSNIDPGDVTVTGAAGGPYTVTFTGRYAGVNVPQMDRSGAALVGTSTVTVATTTQGAHIGYRAPAVNTDPTPNGVAVEAWSRAVLNNSFAADLPYWHWVLPRAKLRLSEVDVLGHEDALTPQFEGTGEENAGFGDGPVGDIAFATDRVFQYCRVASIPTLTAGFVTVLV